MTNRKTVSIDMLLEYANGYLASDYAGGDSAEAQNRRQGVIDLLEASLHAVNRYRGFSYLDDKIITKGRPGIRWENSGHTPSRLFDDTDPTRRRYA